MFAPKLSLPDETPARARRRSALSGPLGLALILALLALGCASGKSSVQARVLELETDLGRVQSQGDRLEERLSALEYRLSQPSSSAPLETELAGPERPELRVVRLAPGETSGPALPAAEQQSSGAVEAETERPTISLRGTSGGTPRAGDDSSPRIEPDAASGEYQAALALVRSGEFEKAARALSSFSQQNPRHPYADNAAYWLGECHYALGDFERAAAEFQGVVERFPGGNKVPDALLKLGMSLSRLGNRKRAEASFAALARAYPSSTATSKIPSEYR